MVFGAPYFLFALLAIPLAVLGYVVLEIRRARRASAWSNVALLPNTVRRPSRRLASVPAALFLVGLTLLLVGFARPQRVLGSINGGAATVVLTFDVSGSMAAEDVQPNRLGAARRIAIRLLKDVPSRDRVAVVTFGNQVHVVVAPTLDHQAAIDHLPTKVTPKAGTAIGDAISDSLAVIARAVGTSDPANPHPPGAVVLLSDGGQTAAGTTPAEAAATAYVEGIPVNTIAVGTPGGSVTQQVTVNGTSIPTQIPVPVDPVTLKQISAQTSGRYFEATSPRSLAGLTSVYQSLRPRPAPAHKKQELAALAAGAALLVIFGGIVVSGFWLGRIA
jgi:Ca-activated chloride channel homolog